MFAQQMLGTKSFMRTGGGVLFKKTNYKVRGYLCFIENSSCLIGTELQSMCSATLSAQQLFWTGCALPSLAVGNNRDIVFWLAVIPTDQLSSLTAEEAGTDHLFTISY